MSTSGKKKYFSKLINFFRGSPYPTIVWQHNSSDLMLDERIVKLTNNSINIKSFRPEDCGSWLISAFNNVGKVSRLQIIIKLLPTVELIDLQVTIPEYCGLNID